MIGIIVLVVLPVFLVIAAGYAATRSGFFSSAAVDGLMVFTQSFAIPCLLFRALVDLNLGEVFNPRLLTSFYVGAVTCFALGILGARVLFRRRPGEAVAVGFSALFSNSVLLGLPIMQHAYGPDSLSPSFAIISIHAPFCYFVGITVMEFARADGRGFASTLHAVLRAMFRSGLMIGLALGFAVNLSGLGLPTPLRAALDMMADAALPAALFGLGGVMTRYAIHANLGESVMIAVLSLGLHPAIAYTLSHLVFDLPPEFVRAAVMTAAMAPGVNTYVFASLYNRAQAQAASSIVLCTGLLVLTAAFWLTVLGGAG
ncbi:MAG: AEC family transporter [Amaricoccus sp.]|uniref:AEC family transporter n=1 Tax=Amaricoccus sp. TaxID=1872485 RepID=UPI0039E36C06